ncbi:MAG: DUF2179 domain-containing protein [Bacteroidetes bacterium]|jgi:uncharacterized protein YebE (UPF0316 family)|nr:DUF2179 domain-containing protein [Bacteroidota bacterium]
MEFLLNALFIFVLRIGDVSLGTLRTLFTVQGKKTLAPVVGLFESLIWVIAIRQIFNQLDNPWNIAGYASGFAMGTLIGILLEQKLAIGFHQIYIISRHYTDEIADALRKNLFGVTIIPGEGGTGGMAIITSMIKRSRLREFQRIVDSIDKQAFISIQNAMLYRGFLHGARK